jgi:alkylation response protein AidB-like acyl-CoA dehydrogenase
MDLRTRLDPVLDVAGRHVDAVDADGRFPVEAVTALRESGLLGLTLAPEVEGMGRGPHELVEVVGRWPGCVARQR